MGRSLGTPPPMPGYRPKKGKQKQETVEVIDEPAKKSVLWIIVYLIYRLSHWLVGRKRK